MQGCRLEESFLNARTFSRIPRHPNCRWSIVPWRLAKTFKEEADKLSPRQKDIAQYWIESPEETAAGMNPKYSSP